MTKNVLTTSAPPSGGNGTFEDLFPFGWRYVRVERPDGTEVLDQVPLTLEDVLHPEEGDVIPEGSTQERERTFLADVFKAKVAGNPTAVVLSDCLVDWGIPGLRAHSPDVSVIFGVENVNRHWG